MTRVSKDDKNDHIKYVGQKYINNNLSHSLNISHGILGGKIEGEKINRNLYFNNPKEAINFMTFISGNSGIETTALMSAEGRTIISYWSDNHTFKKGKYIHNISKPHFPKKIPFIPVNQIHTHPQIKGLPNSGYNIASPADKKAKKAYLQRWHNIHTYILTTKDGKITEF